MLKLLVISDTHGDFSCWEKLQKWNFWDAEMILHAGDVLYHGPRNDLPIHYAPKKLLAALNECPLPLLIAEGNCDAYVDQMVLAMPIQSPYALLQIEDKRVVINHGHFLDEEEKMRMAQKYHADFFITGHTHVPSLQQTDGIIYINPGSTSISKRADQKVTCVLLESTVVTLCDLDSGQIMEELHY